MENIITPSRFPGLWTTPKPPLALWYEGHPESLQLLEKLPERGFAIVGTRDPAIQSLREVENSLRALRGYDFIIVSGFARGIDQKAHEIAVEVGLPTIAILGAGLDLDYPSGSKPLRERIIRNGGLVLSEFPDGTPAYAGNFLKRNRLIASWSKAIWVVEAGANSGTLNTASWAREQGIDCYVTPCYPGAIRFRGNQKLLEERNGTFCFWNPLSLGHTWKELCSLSLKKSEIQDPLARAFQQALRELTATQGAASVEQMVTWAAEQGWAPGQVLSTLRLCLDSGWISDEAGVLSAR